MPENKENQPDSIGDAPVSRIISRIVLGTMHK